MKLKTIKKFLFNACKIMDDNRLKKVKSAFNCDFLLEFSEHKKCRHPLKGLKYFSIDNDPIIQQYLWKYEKEEWYNLLKLIQDFYVVPNKLRRYVDAYCQWYEKNLNN